jgi:hypothetical protein
MPEAGGFVTPLQSVNGAGIPNVYVRQIDIRSDSRTDKRSQHATRLGAPLRQANFYQTLYSSSSDLHEVE